MDEKKYESIREQLHTEIRNAVDNHDRCSFSLAAKRLRHQRNILLGEMSTIHVNDLIWIQSGDSKLRELGF